MIPSVVASEVAGALRDFLATGFGPSNPALAGVVDDFLAEPGNLAKGPYLSIALPFQPAPGGRRALPGNSARVHPVPAPAHRLPAPLTRPAKPVALLEPLSSPYVPPRAMGRGAQHPTVKHHPSRLQA